MFGSWGWITFGVICVTVTIDLIDIFDIISIVIRVFIVVIIGMNRNADRSHFSSAVDVAVDSNVF